MISKEEVGESMTEARGWGNEEGVGRELGALQHRKTQGCRFFRSFREAHALPAPGLCPSECDLGLLASRTVREWIYAVLSHSVCGIFFASAVGN